MKTRKPALFMLLAIIVSLFVGAMSVASQAQDPCVITGPTTGESPETGGTMISYSITCKGNRTVTDEVTVKTRETALTKEALLFKAEDTYTVAGNAAFDKAIHLPPPVVGAEICVKVDDQSKCVTV